MKTPRLFLILSLFAIIFSSCTLPCGSFPAKLAGQWVPYKKGDVLKFQSGTDMVVFEIDSLYISKPYTYQFDMEESCHAEYYICSKKDTYPFFEGSFLLLHNRVISISYMIWFENSSNRDIFSFQYDVKGDYRELYHIKDTISYVIDKNVLTDVLVAESYQPDKLIEAYLHKSKGLVGFTTVDGKEYKLVE